MSGPARSRRAGDARGATPRRRALFSLSPARSGLTACGALVATLRMNPAFAWMAGVTVGVILLVSLLGPHPKLPPFERLIRLCALLLDRRPSRRGSPRPPAVAAQPASTPTCQAARARARRPSGRPATERAGHAVSRRPRAGNRA
jgi:hypothetical protein